MFVVKVYYGRSSSGTVTNVSSFYKRKNINVRVKPRFIYEATVSSMVKYLDSIL